MNATAKKLLHVVGEESRVAFRQWITRDEIPWGYYIIGSIVLVPIMPCIVVVNVVKKMMQPS